MGRTNGKLIPFLRNGLEKKLFDNLKYENQKDDIFNLRLPRYERKKPPQSYEKILKDWYAVNGKAYKYPGYSGAKSVIQAGLKKSVYLVSLPRISPKHPLRFKFANEMEIKENRRKQKEKEQQKSCSRNTPPGSPTASESSGYQSGNESIEADEECSDFFDDLLNHPENYIDENDNFSDIFDDMGDSNIQSADTGVFPALPDDPSFQNLLNMFEECNVTVVDPIDFLNTYWLCTRKVPIGSILLLICEKQVIPVGNQGIAPDQIVIPNEFFQAGSYCLQKRLEIDGKCLLFFSPC